MFPVILFAQGKTKKAHVKPDTTVYTSVDVLPEFPGGMAGWGKYTSKNFSYPQDTTKEIQFSFKIRMIVEKDGSLSNVKIFKVVNKTACDSLIAFIRHSPKWKPGLMRNKPVRVAYSFPISISPALEE